MVPGDPERASIDELTAVVRQEGRSAAGVDALAAIFARSGIAVFDDDLTAPLHPVETTISPLIFQRWQLEPFAEEIGKGAAAPAGVLNDLIPPEADGDAPVPTAADLLAAYTVAGDTPGASFARALVRTMPGTDAVPLEVESAMVPAPAALWAVMGGEVLGQVEEETKRLPSIPNVPVLPSLPALPGLPEFPAPILPAGVSLPPLPQLDESFCSSVQMFLNATMQRVFSTLSRSDAVEEIPVIGTLWAGIKKGVRLALEGIVILVTKTVDVVIKPVLSVLKAVFGAIALASTVVGTLTPWTASIAPNPNRTRLGVGAFEVLSGELQVEAGGFDRIDWPPLLADCAQVAGLPLPEPTAAGASFTLTIRQPGVTLIEVDANPRELDRSARASVTFATKNETEELARTGEAVTGIVYFTLDVERNDLAQIRDKLANLLFANLGELLRSIVEPMVRPIINDLTAKLLALVKASGHGMVFVTYHRPRQPTPTAVAPAGEPSLVGTWEITPADDWLALVGVDPRADTGWGYVIDLLEGRWTLGFAADGTARSTASGCRVAFHAAGEWGEDDHGTVELGVESSLSGTVLGSYVARRGRIFWTWTASPDFSSRGAASGHDEHNIGTAFDVDLGPEGGLSLMQQRLVSARYRVKGDTLTLRCTPKDDGFSDDFVLSLRKVGG